MKIIKKLSKMMIATSLVIGFTLISIQPVTNVLADDTYVVKLTFEVDESSDVTLLARGANGNVENGETGDELVGKRGDGDIFIDIKDTADNTKFSHENMSVVCDSDKLCIVTLTVPTGHGVKAVTPGGTPFKFFVDGHEYNASQDIIQDEVFQVVNFDDDREEFDGNAYLIWSCENGTCYKLFTGITSEPMFIAEEEIIADNNRNEKFDVHAKYKNFASQKDFEGWQEDYKAYKNVDIIDFSSLDTSIVIEPLDMREYEEDAIKDGACTKENADRKDFEHCVDGYVGSKGIFNSRAGYQPVGEPTLNNAYVSYADRNFKMTIYNKDYRGISIGSLDDLNYYPAVWNDDFLRVESYDISGTNEDTATIIDTVLLEQTTNIKALLYNDFEIKSIEAIDVPNNAVSISKVNDEFKITFASNFYDNVLFKVTSKDNKIYYFRIRRMTLNTNLMHDNHKSFISSYFYFDNKTSYEDYTIKAKIIYKDGTSKIFEMENAKKIDDGLGNPLFTYEVDQEKITEGPKGKGLKVAAYEYELSSEEEEKISKVYINVEYKGSTKDTYAGAFAGSGKGVVMDFEEEYR